MARLARLDKHMPILQAENTTLQQILTILGQHHDGLSSAELADRLPAIPKRTLQRYLKQLKTQEQIMVAGKGKGTLYFLPQSHEVPLCKTAISIREQIQQPVTERRPVGYHKEFLYNYQPNTTYYLPDTVRQHLHTIGKRFEQELTPGTYAKKILHRLLIDLSWNSSRLEGNTYSLIETERLIALGAEASGKSAFEAQMILNHKDAIEFISTQASELGINKYTILNTHALLSNNLLANPKARGQLRQIPVGIGRTVYHPPEIPQLIDEYFCELLEIAAKIKDPFEQSFFMMVQLPYLQPFEDVNKRVSRLAANIPLIQHNLSPLSFIDVPKNDYVSGIVAIYELNRIEILRDVYIWAYERSAQQYQLIIDAIGEPNLVYMRFKGELKTLINTIINNNTTNAEIIKTIETWANTHIEMQDRPAFIQLAEQEIASLHEGNLSIYGINPVVFTTWQENR